MVSAVLDLAEADAASVRAELCDQSRVAEQGKPEIHLEVGVDHAVELGSGATGD